MQQARRILGAELARHRAQLHHPLHMVGVVHRVEHHHQSQVRVSDRNEALDPEMAAHGFQVLDVLLDREEVAVLDSRGAAAVPHVVEDERVTRAERGQVAGQKQPARHDDRGAAAPIFS